MAELTLKYIGILTMQCALKIRILLIIVLHIWLSVTVIGASPHHNLPVSNLLPKEKVNPALEAANAPEDGVQTAKEALPLVNVAHKSVMDLLYLFFVSTPIHISSYTPFVQQVGIRINWFELLRNLSPNAQKSYGGGVDLHFSGPIQLSVDIGYVSYQAKDIVYPNQHQLRYRSKGRYGLVALLYVLHPNHLCNAYCGIAYGQSRFDLITFSSDHITATSKPLVAGWIKCIVGSESRLGAQLYGGLKFEGAYLLHCKQDDEYRLPDCSSIPGYGRIANKIVCNIVVYIKWSICFLEKKIVA